MAREHVASNRRLRRAALAALTLTLPAAALVGPGCAAEPSDGLVSETRQALTTCVTIQRGTLGAVEDTTLVPNISYPGWGSTQQTLSVSGDTEALLKFDLSAVPANATVTSATLRLSTTAEYSNVLLFARYAVAPWTEGTASFPGFNQQVFNKTLGSMTPSAPNTVHAMALKPAVVQSWVSGSLPNHGFMLETMLTRSYGWQARTVFASSEAPTAALRPSLEVCYTPFDFCAGHPCQNGGACESGVSGYTCACAPGFGGADCETNIDDCAGNPCQNGGACADGVNSYSCQCAAGYEGARCETDIDECAGGPCQNGGVCSDHVASYSCACPPGFTGTDCEVNIDECAGNPCLNGGACADGVNGYACQCAAGFTGTNCQVDVDDCAGNACQNGSACVDGINAYSCACVPGYSGARCEVNIDDCAGNPCQNGGACVDGVNGYACQCAAGFTGTNCQINVDDCTPNPCQNGGTCTDGVNGYTCVCSAGWTGAACNTAAGSSPFMRRVGTSTGDESVERVVSTPSGIYVIGSLIGASDLGGGPIGATSSRRGFVLALDPNGNYRWSQVLAASSSVYVRDVAVDAADNLYVYGGYSGTPTFYGLPAGPAIGNGYVLSLTSGGSLRWARTLGNSFPFGLGGLALGPTGDLIVGGRMSAASNYGGGTIGATNHGYILALNPATGAHVWSRTFGAGSMGGGIYRLTLGSDGSIYAVGENVGAFSFGGTSGTLPAAAPGYDNNFFLAKLDTTGLGVWAVGYSPFHNMEKVGMSLSADGKIAVLLEANTNCGCTNRPLSIGGTSFFPSNIAPNPYGMSLVGVYSATNGAHLASWSVDNSNTAQAGGIAWTPSNELLVGASVRDAATFGGLTVTPPATGQYTSVLVRYTASGAVLAAVGGGGYSSLRTMRIEPSGTVIAGGYVGGGTVGFGGGSATHGGGTAPDGWVSRFSPP